MSQREGIVGDVNDESSAHHEAPPPTEGRGRGRSDGSNRGRRSPRGRGRTSRGGRAIEHPINDELVGNPMPQQIPMPKLNPMPQQNPASTQDVVLTGLQGVTRAVKALTSIIVDHVARTNTPAREANQQVQVGPPGPQIPFVPQIPQERRTTIVTLPQFLWLKPPTFSGSDANQDPEEFIVDVERVCEALGCSDCATRIEMCGKEEDDAVKKRKCGGEDRYGSSSTGGFSKGTKAHTYQRFSQSPSGLSAPSYPRRYGFGEICGDSPRRRAEWSRELGDLEQHLFCFFEVVRCYGFRTLKQCSRAPSPVSVLDGSAYRDGVTSPVQQISSAPKADDAQESRENGYGYQRSPINNSLVFNSTGSREINREKL
ncbi:protein LONGIFOLIA 2 isoform X1 [Senna tora]|uniref:Protein LONGIFOLIA 2 isoform X1 n=1 Tax=Senna tora TaxID=362788 RepID=A0A834T468_9FABA|nr:protein LONGIFOLIA 2 isoform X1 [Senna tora]